MSGRRSGSPSSTTASTAAVPGTLNIEAEITEALLWRSSIVYRICSRPAEDTGIEDDGDDSAQVREARRWL